MSEQNEIALELGGLESGLGSMSRAMPFSVPDGYFEALQVQLEQATGANFSDPLLAKYDQPLSLPVGYFETLPGKLLVAARRADANEVPKKQKEIGFVPVLRWAVAAALAITISVGGYMMFVERSESQSEAMLKNISRGDIMDFVQGSYGTGSSAQSATHETVIPNVDNAAIIQYLNETGWEDI